jgi:hypothetical protein
VILEDILPIYAVFSISNNRHVVLVSLSEKRKEKERQENFKVKCIM